jgi:hypothetical protein
MALFISNKQKHYVFLIISSVFSSTKSENERAEYFGPRRGGGVGVAQAMYKSE